VNPLETCTNLLASYPGQCINPFTIRNIEYIDSERSGRDDNNNYQCLSNRRKTKRATAVIANNSHSYVGLVEDSREHETS
jgi:hypothetical protein